MKKCLLLFLLFVAFNAAAQDTYEYGVVNWKPDKKILQVTLGNNPMKETDVPKDKVTRNDDPAIGLMEVNKLAEQGWEVFNASTAVISASYNWQIYSYFLRRKRTN